MNLSIVNLTIVYNDLLRDCLSIRFRSNSYTLTSSLDFINLINLIHRLSVFLLNVSVPYSLRSKLILLIFFYSYNLLLFVLIPNVKLYGI